MLFGTSVSDNPLPRPSGRYSPLVVSPFAFEILFPIMLLESFVQDLRRPRLHACFHLFDIYFNYATVDVGLSIGPGGHFLETMIRYHVSENN